MAWMTTSKLLNKLPARRFESAKQIAEILEDCLAHAQQPNTSPLPELVQKLRLVNPTTAEIRTRILHKIAFPILLVVAAVALFIFLGLGFLHDRIRQETSPNITKPSVASNAGALSEATSQTHDTKSPATEPSDVSPNERWQDGIDQTLNALNQDLDILQSTFVEPITP